MSETSDREMTLKEYNDFVGAMWLGEKELKECGLKDLFICATGLAGESGEVSEKLKKFVRDGSLDRELLTKEMGDTLYYLTALALMFGTDLQSVMEANVKKLTDRRDRGVMRGSGDAR